MRILLADRHRTAVAAAALLALAAVVLVSMSPVIVVAVAAYAWGRVAVRRWGWGAGVSLVVVGWASVTFFVLCLTPALHIDPSLVLAVVWAAMAIGASFIAAPEPSLAQLAQLAPLPRGSMIASLSGAAVWALAVGLAKVLPHGSGLSWAVYSDSSLDVWAIRQNVAHGGVHVYPSTNPRPVEHALTTSFLPPYHPLDSSSSTFVTEIGTHALNWSILIALTCVLAGLVVAEATRGIDRLRRAAPVFAGIMSLGVLAAPVTGVMLGRGQINGHLNLVLMLSAVLISIRAARAPHLAVAALLLNVTLLMLVWTPLAAVPGMLALTVAWQYRRDLVAGGSRTLMSLGPPLIFFAWSLISFALDGMISLIKGGETAQESLVSIPTRYPQPVWLPLTFAAFFGSAALRVAQTRRPTDLARSILPLLAGLALGAAPLFIPRGGFGGELGYYPARYLSMLTIVLVPVIVGLTLQLAACTTLLSRVCAGSVAATVVTLAVVAPLPPSVSRWGYTPVDVATGNAFGTHADVYDRIIAYASDDTLMLAWHDDPDFDFHINWMISVDDTGDRTIWSTYVRSAIRYAVPGDMSVSRACEIGRTSERPVVLFTRDSSLESSIDNACPDAHIEVRLQDSAKS